MGDRKGATDGFRIVSRAGEHGPGERSARVGAEVVPGCRPAHAGARSTRFQVERVLLLFDATEERPSRAGARTS